MSNRSRTRRATQLAGRQRARIRLQRAGWISAVAATALLVVALGGVAVWQANRPDDAAVPVGAVADGHGVPVGTGPVTVELYLDFLCPACKQFDTAARPALEQYLADGTVTLVYRPIAILDRLTSTEFSTRAAAAAGCAADGGGLDRFVALMMDRQPPEGSTGLSDDEIVQIGRDAGLTGPGFGQCVRDGTYLDWAAANTDASADRGVQGTPTVYVDGAELTAPSLDRLVAAVDAAAGSR